MNCVVRFPDGTHTVLSMPPGHECKVGDEIMPLWRVRRVNLLEQFVDGQVVQFEAVVIPVEPDAFTPGMPQRR